MLRVPLADVAGADVEWTAPLFWALVPIVVLIAAVLLGARAPRPTVPDRGGVSGLPRYRGGR